MTFSRIAILTAAVLLLHSCDHDDETMVPPVEETVPGGTGGSFHIAIFPETGKTGVSGKCYIRYACKSLPSAPVTYDDSAATMVEPGYGPHTHFNDLKTGYYLISAKCLNKGQAVGGDTIIEIIESQAALTDYHFQVK